jgi:hypothetical protein
MQILSDEALRANYDASGKDSVEAAPKVDPATLFAMIFGSEKFVPLVGECTGATVKSSIIRARITCVFCVGAWSHLSRRRLRCPQCILVLLLGAPLYPSLSHFIFTRLYFTRTGELKLASQMQQDESEQSVPKLKKFRQRKREVQCAVNLAQKVQPFIDLNENEEVRWHCTPWFLLLYSH